MHFISVEVIDLRSLVTKVLHCYQGEILFHGKSLRPR